jgi:hypothetical protein
MTTLTRSAPRTGRRRPVPWARLAWVSWRQRRVALITVAIVLAALSLYLLIMGLQIRSGYAGVTGCHPASSTRCGILMSNFTVTYYQSFGAPMFDNIGKPNGVSALLLAVPVLLGVFAGAPLLARELETGTFRFAWTQGCGRLRWALAQLALPAIALTAAAGAFSVLFSWYMRPFTALFDSGRGKSAMQPTEFPVHGVAFAAWTLAAFAIGAFAGVTIRRTAPAIAAAMAAWVALALATAVFLRPHYEAPLRTSGGAPHQQPASLTNSWVLSSWTTGPGGRQVSATRLNSLVPASIQNANQPNAFPDWLTRHHYTQWWSYQPLSRYGHFQLIEGGWLLALSVVLIAATVWMIRRRTW